MFALYSVCSIQCLQHRVFAVHRVCSIQCLLYTVFAVHSVCSTQCLQYTVFRRIYNRYFEYQFSNGSILTLSLLSVDTRFAGV